jgi:hypothetical protein
MTCLLHVAAAAAIATALWASPASAGSPVLLHEVTDVELRREGGSLVVSARGLANTGGYSDPRLSAEGTTADGTLVVDFLVDPPPPNSMVTTVLTPHRAELAIPDADGVRAVEVRGAHGSITAATR